MPIKIKNIRLLRGEAFDASRYNKNTLFIRGLEGFDVGPALDGDRNTIVSAGGSEFVTTRYSQRAPFGGATSDAEELSSNEVDHLNSKPGSMTLLILSIPGVKGNVLSWTSNGNNDITTQVLVPDVPNPRQWLGHQGHVLSVYQELWGGKEGVTKAGTPALSGHYE